jgi:hypothetical protein
VIEGYPTRLVLTGPFLEDTATTASVDPFGYFFEYDTASSGGPFADGMTIECYSRTWSGHFVEDIEDVAFGDEIASFSPMPTYSDADSDPDALSFDPFQNEFTFYVGNINSGEVVFALYCEPADCIQQEFAFENADGPYGNGCSEEGPRSNQATVSFFSFLRIPIIALRSIRRVLSKKVRSLFGVHCGQGC